MYIYTHGILEHVVPEETVEKLPERIPDHPHKNLNAFEEHI